MEIQSASAYAAYSYLNISSHQKQAPADVTVNLSASGANISDTVAISQTARNHLATQSNSAVASGSGATAVFDTDQGSKTLNIDDYFSNKGTTFSLHTLPPLLFSSPNNIDALTKHVSATFPLLLAQNNIPSAPSSITYDNKGQIELPSDYPYASELKQALANNPTMAKELRTVNVLSSNFAGMRKLYPVIKEFNQEYAAAATPAQVEAVVAKYSYLFEDNRNYSAIALHFSEGGSLSITADGKPLLADG